MKSPRKEKICPYCIYYIPETENMEGECKADEDTEAEAYCETFEKKGDRDG